MWSRIGHNRRCQLSERVDTRQSWKVRSCLAAWRLSFFVTSREFNCFTRFLTLESLGFIVSVLYSLYTIEVLDCALSVVKASTQEAVEHEIGVG